MNKTAKALRRLWILAFVLSVFLLLSAAVSAAENHRIGDWEYRVENGTATIAKYYGTAASVTLPTSVKINGLTYKLRAVEKEAFIDNYNLRSVVIPKEITKLGWCVFKNCTNLNSVTINGDLADGERASADAGWTYDVGYSIFYNTGTNSDTFTVTFGEGVTYIPGCMFSTTSEKGKGVYCHVTKVVIPSTAEKIGLYAFGRCYDLAEVSFANGCHLSEIGEKAFFFCGLKSVNIPGKVITIADYAFDTCAAMKTAIIPESVKNIGKGAFHNCTNLTNVTVKGDLPDASSGSKEDWQDKEQAVFYNTGTNSDSFTLTFAEGVTYIPAYMFATGHAENQNVFCGITKVVIPRTVKSIEIYAFYNCYKLSAATFAGSKTEFSKISIKEGNELLTSAKISYSYSDPGTEPGVDPGDFRFADVRNSNDYYYDAVYWAYNASPQITNGVDTTHFGPDKGCTRAQVVTFLWRSAGCPEPKNPRSASSFSDVGAEAFYSKAVAWAVENQITNGVSATRFSPDATCTRAQIVTFLWRFNHCVEPKGKKTGFTDVDVNEFYGKAVIWAVENQITNGVTATSFAPNKTCTRGQIVTFLYRSMN